MKKAFERIVRNVETNNAFNPRWYAIVFHPFYITRKALFNRIKAFADTLKPNQKVLDVGCGTKPYESLFRTKDFVGIDVEGGGLDDKKKSVDTYFDGEHIPFPDNEFDVAIATEVFEHVNNLDLLTQEIHRVLKKNGQVLITMPFVWSEHSVPYDFRRFTSFGHKKNLIEHHFHSIETHPTTGVFGTSGQIISDFIAVSSFNFIEKMPSSGLGYKFKFVLERLIVILFCFPIQLIFFGLDKLFRHRGITLDFIVTAKK